MRFRKPILLFIFAVCLLASSSFALAEDEVKVEIIGAEPVELSEAGPITVVFEISNHSDYELSDISIVLGDFVCKELQEEIIPVGGSGKITVEGIQVLDSQIGLPLVFRINWSCAGEPYFLNREVTIGRAVEPTISMSRTVSDSHARIGQKLTLSYVLKNETKFDMTDIMLIDDQISDNPIRRNDTLRANDSFQIDYTYTMGSTDVVSAPIVTYVVNGKTKSFSAVEPITLSMVNVDVRLEVERGTPSATGVPFTFVAKNMGNQKVSDLVIKDELGNTINSTPFSLDAGASQTLSYTAAPVAGESIRNATFKLTGTDPFGDACSSETSDVFQIYPYVDDSQVQVSVQGQITTEWSAQTGTVAVKLLIQNNSSVTLTNAVLSEASLGALSTYSTLPSGQTVYEAELLIGSPRNLNLSIQVTDPSGTERTAATYLLTVAYPEATEAPIANTEVPAPEPTPTSGIWNNIITRVLIILGSILIIAFAVLLILTILERGHFAGQSSLYLDEDEDLLDDFDEIFDETASQYASNDEFTDEYGEPLTPDYLRRAKLYIPPEQYQQSTADMDHDGAPTFEELIHSAPASETDTFRRPQRSTEFEYCADDELVSREAQSRNATSSHTQAMRVNSRQAFAESDEEFESTDFFASDDYLADAANFRSQNTDVAAKLVDTTVSQSVPKTIVTRQAPRTHRQNKNTIKRVTTSHEEEF